MVRTARRTAPGPPTRDRRMPARERAGCQLDGPRTAWRSSPAGESRADCPGRCRQTSVPCPEYQPTVWDSWRSGPMAVRSNDQCAEPDPSWLNNPPKPRVSPGIKASREIIPAPPVRPGEAPRPASATASSFSRQRVGILPTARQCSSKPELGEGFKLDPHAPQVKPAGDDEKPAIKGLETTPETPTRLQKPAPGMRVATVRLPPRRAGHFPCDRSL